MLGTSEHRIFSASSCCPSSINEVGEPMLRFYFSLAGQQNVDDPFGLAFENELQAFRAAERFASDLASVQPSLRGTTWVVVTRKDRDEIYLIGI